MVQKYNKKFKVEIKQVYIKHPDMTPMELIVSGSHLSKTALP
jgi:phosphoribosylformylglycinamidine (FGAM) synthase-like enzyme